MEIQYPVMLDLRNRQCVIVGGGKVAERKLLGVLECGAVISVVSPTLSGSLEVLWSEGRFIWHKDCYHDKYLETAFICFACTDNHGVNIQISEHAEAKGILVNAADNSSISSFTVPAVRRRGDVTLSVYSNENPGASRYLAQSLIDGLEEWQLDYISLIKVIRKRCRLLIKEDVQRQQFISSLFSEKFIALAKLDLKAVEAEINGLLYKSGGAKVDEQD